MISRQNSIPKISRDQSKKKLLRSMTSVVQVPDKRIAHFHESVIGVDKKILVVDD